MKVSSSISFIAICCLAVSVSSCGGQKTTAREVFGLERSAPDEFSVVSRPALSVPKEFFLNPPSYEGGAVKRNRADKVAREIVTSTAANPSGSNNNNASSGSDIGVHIEEADLIEQGRVPEDKTMVTVDNGNITSSDNNNNIAEDRARGELILLDRAGANHADDNIRSKLIEEEWTAKYGGEETSIWDNFRKNGFATDEEDIEPVVDAAKEQERIRSNVHNNKPINEGEVEKVMPANKTIFDKMSEWF